MKPQRLKLAEFKETKLEDIPIETQVIPVKAAFVCINCRCLVNNREEQKGRLLCPSCGSVEVYPLSKWF